MLGKLLRRVSEVTTNPPASPPAREFDVADLYRGPVELDESLAATALPLDEKLRQAYFCIVNHAIISPFYDIEYHEGPPQSFLFGDAKGSVTLPSGQS
jgi:MoxR-like ATPase